MKPLKECDSRSDIIYDLKIPTIAQIQALQSLITSLQDKVTTQELELLRLTLHSCILTNRIIDTFTALESLKSERMKLNFEKFNMVELAKNVMFESEILFKYCNLHLDFLSDDELIICADKSKVQYVIENIILNSVNCAFCNTSIFVSLKKSKNDAIFEVKYTSFFIDQTKLKNVFSIYENPLAYSINTGLGMRLCYEITKAHFGKTIAKSSVDNTNTLGFMIPIK